MSDTAERGLVARSRAFVEQLALPTPPFDFTIDWAPDHDALFRREFSRQTDVDAMVDGSLRSGRVLLQASGGAGKTSILRRVAKAAIDRGVLVILADLREWTPGLTRDWVELADSEPQRMSLLLDRLGQPATSEEELRHVASDTHRLVLVDGLNEVPRDLGDAMIHTLDAFARRNTQAGVIATDRLVRRAVDESMWMLATIAPLDGDDGLRGNAFFRDLALRESIDFTSSAAAHSKYLATHAGLDEREVQSLGNAALRLYELTYSRTFPMSALEEYAGRDITVRVDDAGVVVHHEGGASFKHHLIHDFLASVALASDRDLWHRPAFNAATLRASSFDVLAMALEQLAEPTQADLLVRRIFDWNFYGAAYAVSTCRRRGSGHVSETMEVALLSMLAERRWDVFRATSQQVTDALALYPSGVAQELLQAEQLTSVFEIVTRLVGDDPALLRWLELFTTTPGQTVSDEAVALIRDADSLLGWTAANVLKRCQLSPEQLADLRETLVAGETHTIRWRAAHALGADPSPETVEGLFGALTDHDDVRYGAMRSLLELAALSESLAPDIVTRVRSLVTDIPQIVRQLERSVLLRVPPAWWTKTVGPLIEDLWAAAPSEEAQDRWRVVAFQLGQRSDNGQGSLVA